MSKRFRAADITYTWHRDAPAMVLPEAGETPEKRRARQMRAAMASAATRRRLRAERAVEGER
jgi:hypothetical protein